MGLQLRSVGRSGLAGALAQAGTTPSPQEFRALFSKGPAAAIDVLLDKVREWNIALAQPNYDQRLILARRSAKEAAVFARASANYLQETAEVIAKAGTFRYDISIAPRLIEILLAEISSVTATMLTKATELEAYSQASRSMERIQRAIVLMLEDAKLGYKAAEAGRESAAGKILLLFDKTLDTVVALFEAILAVLMALAGIVTTAAKYWPIVLVGVGVFLLWYFFRDDRRRPGA